MAVGFVSASPTARIRCSIRSPTMLALLPLASNIVWRPSIRILRALTTPKQRFGGWQITLNENLECRNLLLEVNPQELHCQQLQPCDCATDEAIPGLQV